MDDAPLRLPTRTTPTWEMELLISGATVFGLIQLPERLGALITDWMNASDGLVLPFLGPLGVYLQFSVLMLVLTFVLHLCLRGYWVALVGLDSVYPDGIRWERLRLGPNARRAGRDAVGSMAERIEAADNRATRVFAVGFGLAVAMLLPILVVGCMIAVMTAARLLHWDARVAQALAWTCLVLLVAPVVLAHVLDRLIGARLAPEGRAARSVRAVLGAYARLAASRGGNPLLALYSSQVGARRAGIIISVLMFSAMGLAAASLLGRRVDWSAGSFAGLPAENGDSAANLVNERYDSLRGDAHPLQPPPSIPDPVASGPYLRLFVPYLPARHNAALTRACPESLAPKAVEQGEALQCLARLHALRLDGQPVSVPWLASRDPRSGQRGAVAMIPLAGLAEGRHELSLQRLRRGGEPAEDAVVRIPFWK